MMPIDLLFWGLTVIILTIIIVPLGLTYWYEKKHNDD